MPRVLLKSIVIVMLGGLAACSVQPPSKPLSSTPVVVPSTTPEPVVPTTASTTSMVESKAWRLLSLPQSFVSGPSMRDIYIRFYPDKGMFDGHTGCNAIRGKYKINSEQINLTEFAGSNLPCDAITFEAVYIQALSEAIYWQVTDNKLTLLDENKKRLAVFEGQ